MQSGVPISLAVAATAILSLFLLYEFTNNALHNGIRTDGARTRRLFLIEANISTNKGPVWTENYSKDEKSCDIFSGKWVQDESYPLYGSLDNCPYLSSEFNCKANGRPDSNYLKWRWQPAKCNIPRFKSTNMLKMLRGKRLMFVGDSLSRNQWESMICMLQISIPNSEKSASLRNPLSTFTALNYNASVDFFWAPFLVELGSGYVGNSLKRILRLDSIEENAKYWKGVDILVFNSVHWWEHTGNLRAWDYIQHGGKLYQNMDPMVAYAKGMTTWANWIDSNVNHRQTQVIFTSISPAYSSGICYNKTEPIKSYELSSFHPQMGVIESILVKMTVPVEYMNITRLSDYRRDAHPSIYWDSSQQKRSNSQMNGDCSHWCVSGLPDIWNELLFSMLLPL